MLSDFVWTRAHPKARRKMPNRASRGSQFGREDFDDFCALAARLAGRSRTWSAVMTISRSAGPSTRRTRHIRFSRPNAMSRRLPREVFGPYVRVPTAARYVPGALPQLHRLHLPDDLVRAAFPPELDDPAASDASGDPATGLDAEHAP